LRFRIKLHIDNDIDLKAMRQIEDAEFRRR